MPPSVFWRRRARTNFWFVCETMIMYPGHGTIAPALTTSFSNTLPCPLRSIPCFSPPPVLDIAYHALLIQGLNSTSPPDYKASLCTQSASPQPRRKATPDHRLDANDSRSSLASRNRQQGSRSGSGPLPAADPGLARTWRRWAARRLSFLGLDEGKACQVASLLASREPCSRGCVRRPAVSQTLSRRGRSIRCTESG